MKRCQQCNTALITGYAGRGEAGRSFCSEACYTKGVVLKQLLESVSPAAIAAGIQQIHDGNCPRCKGPGPVEVCTANKVWSAVYISMRSYKTYVCCKRCSNKLLGGATLFSCVLGWWSVRGLLFTPFIVFSNVRAMMTRIQAQPSAAMHKHLEVAVAQQLAAPTSNATWQAMPAVPMANAALNGGQPAISAPPIPDPSGQRTPPPPVQPPPRFKAGEKPLMSEENPFSTLKQ